MHELVLRVPHELVEAVSDVLMDEFDALSVSVEDADAGKRRAAALCRAGHAASACWVAPLNAACAVRR